jgi:hypothetical protein
MWVYGRDIGFNFIVFMDIFFNFYLFIFQLCACRGIADPTGGILDLYSMKSYACPARGDTSLLRGEKISCSLAHELETSLCSALNRSKVRAELSPELSERVPVTLFRLGCADSF